MLPSFRQRAEGFSTFVTFSWWRWGCEYLMDFSFLLSQIPWCTKDFRAGRTNDWCRFSTRVRPCWFEIDSSGKKNFFQEIYQVFTKADFDKAKTRSEKFFKNQIWIKTVLNSITWVKHKINSGFEVIVVLGFIWFYEMSVNSVLGK